MDAVHFTKQIMLADFSPFSTNRGGQVIASFDSEPAVGTPDWVSPLEDFCWSPSGDRLAVSVDCTRAREHAQLWIYPVDGAAPFQVPGPPDEDNLLITGVSWSPDGTTIAMTTRTGRSADLQLVDTRTWSRSTLYTSAEPPYGATSGWSAFSSPSWAPDGSQIMFDRETLFPDEHRLAVINVDGTSYRVLPPSQTVAAPDWGIAGPPIIPASLLNLTRRYIIHLFHGDRGLAVEDPLTDTRFEQTRRVTQLATAAAIGFLLGTRIRRSK